MVDWLDKMIHILRLTPANSYTYHTLTQIYQIVGIKNKGFMINKEAERLLPSY